MELGQLLRSAAIIGAGPELPPAAHPADWAGQPGTRAPHAWIQQGDCMISILDLFKQRFTLITADARWAELARHADMADGLDIVLVGRDVSFATPDAFGGLFCLKDSGATLVRPDGIICWRAVAWPEGDAAECLRAVVKTVAMLTRRLSR
jgi:putative polyketide hydroxylase